MEKVLWNLVRKHLPSGRYSRIESNTSPGIPDVSYTINGHRGWIELKDAGDTNAKLPFKRKGLRPDQINWFRDEIKAGGSSKLFILARVNKLIFLVDGLYFEEFNDFTLWDLQNKSRFHTTSHQLGLEKNSLTKILRGSP